MFDNLEIYAKLIDLTSDGMYIYDMEGVIHFANKGVAKLLDHKDPKDLIGKKISDVIIYTQPAHTIRNELLKNGHIKDMKYCYKTLSGEPRCVMHNSILWKKLDTESYVVSVVKDITSLELKTQELDSLNQQMNITLSSIGEAVVATDDLGNIVKLNRSAEKILSVRLEDCIHKSLDSIICFEQDSMNSGTPSLISKVLARDEFFGPITMNVTLVNTGVTLKVILNASPLTSVSGQKIGVLLSFRDISEFSRLENQLRHSQKMETIGRLSGGLAHDFNNQLSIIRGCIDLLEMSGKANSGMSEYIDLVHEAIDQAEGVVTQLLTFARQGNMSKETFDIHEEIASVINLVGHSFDPEITFLCDFSAHEKMVHGNRNQLHNMLVNLYVNARDSFSSHGKIQVRTRNCKISDQDPAKPELGIGEYIELCIEDNGSGMAPEVLDRIFDPFYTTKELGKGTGLGLSVVYGIVKEHGGEIKAFSTPGKGSEFKIWLPVSRKFAIERNKSERDAFPKFSGKILLVDDEASLRKVYSKLLFDIGFDVFTASNGQEGLEIFRKSHDVLDLVILDLMMPEMDGIETFHRMQAIRQDVPVIFVTGYAYEIDTRLDSQEFEVIYKPAKFNTLYSTIRRVMEKKGSFSNA